MFVIPVVVTDDGAVVVTETAPKEAVLTVLTHDGCRVYMPGDELPT